MTPKGDGSILRVTLVQGGASGYDQVPAVKEILCGAGVRIEWDEYLAGWASLEQKGEALPAAMLESVRTTGLALKTRLLPPPTQARSASEGTTPTRSVSEGRITNPSYGDSAGKVGNYNVQLRRELGVFASVRPLKNLPGLPARFHNVDMLVIRELTEDLYAAIEHEIVPGVVQSIKVVTESASRRFLRFAFEYARSAGRKAIACVHKANILKQADGLFLEAFRAMAREFPDLQTRELIVDNCCMQMVLKPQQFDVMVMGNLYGDIVSDLAAGIVGGVSAAAGINFGAGLVVYESLHGGETAIPPGRANPLPLLLPALHLLEAQGEKSAARRIRTAVGQVLTERRALTTELGGRATTAEMVQAILAALP
jgi:isocitrate dehydrogenase (NAD+)